MRQKAAETRLYRKDMNERILGAGHKEFNRFFALDANAFEEGAIDVPNKELMGLVGSMVLRCNDCISYHLDRCVTEGCNQKQIYEAMNIGLVIGGSVVIPHLRHAFEVLDQLLPED